jgi:hypothetical protein
MKFKGQGSDILWLLLGVVLIFGTMAAFSPGSIVGKNFVGVRKNLESMFGGELGYCPFINPYAMTLYSSGQLEITGDHPLCGPLKYAIGEISRDKFMLGGVNCSDIVDDKLEYAVYSLSIESVDNYCADEPVGGTEESVNCINASKSGVHPLKDADGVNNLTTIKNVKGDIKYYPDLGTATADDVDIAEFSSDYFFAKLSDVQQSEIDKSNRVAIQLMTEKRPAWQCFLIFGILPFAITYYLLNDILLFTMLRTNTKRLIAIFASLIAVLTGAFANLVVAVSSLVGMTVGQSFLLAIFSFAVIAVFLSQIMATAGATKATVKAVNDTVTAMMTLGAIGQTAQAQQQGRQNP